MMKNIVLYKSKYGHTYQYAQWLAETLNYEIRDLSHFKKREIKHYQTIIFGSGVYQNNMNQIKKVLRWFKDQPIIIFACGGHLSIPKDIERVKEDNFTVKQLAFHTFFYLPGGIDFTQVKGVMKWMLEFYRKKLDKKPNRTADEQAILDGFHQPTDYVDQKELEALLAYVKTLDSTAY